MATIGDAKRWRKQGRGYVPPPNAAEARVAKLEDALREIANAPDDGGWNERVFIAIAQRALKGENA